MDIENTQRKMNALIALVIVITLLSLHNCNVLAQNCVTLDGWDGGFSRFEWRMTGDVLEGFVVYNKKNLDQGWVALGISDFQVCSIEKTFDQLN